MLGQVDGIVRCANGYIYPYLYYSIYVSVNNCCLFSLLKYPTVCSRNLIFYFDTLLRFEYQ